MKVEDTRTSSAVRLRHAAGSFASQRHLLDQLVPLVSAAQSRGEPVAVAVSPATEEALLDALGRGGGLIPLDGPDGPNGGSGQTVATRRARDLRELTAGAGAVTVVTEHRSRFDGSDGSFWTELDAALNVALADLPVQLTCFFPEMPLHLEVLDGARRNHPTLLVGGQLRRNPDHLDPRRVMREYPAPAPALLGAPDLDLTFGAWQLNEIRASLEACLLAVGFGATRAEDVVLAVNEVATNAVEHGADAAQLCAWFAPDGMACEIHDRGSLRDPLPGLQAPHFADPRGRGVWIARQLCDSLHVWADALGTHVRMYALP